MADNAGNFCSYCGQRIEPGATFCPSCGALLAKEAGSQPQAAPQQNAAPSNKAANSDLKTRLTVWSVVIVITAAIFAYFGISYLVTVDQIVNILQNDPSWPDLVQQMVEAGYTEQDLVDMIRTVTGVFGYIFILAAVTALVGAICGFTKKMYTIGLVMYICTTILTCWTIVGLIVGIIGCVRYASTKPCFAN